MELKKISLALGERSYEIFIGRGAYGLVDDEIKMRKEKGNPLALVSENNIWNVFIEPPKESVSANIILESGESSKSFENLKKITREMAQAKLDRSGAVFALGGGVVGDIAGFAASVYMRGIDFYQVPTTLLAMVDSSVGGKTAINIPEGKNLLGAFYQPKAVFIDTKFLDTLPKREFAAGMAEVIKYGLLGDKEFFEKMEKLSEPLNSKHELMPEIIAHSCKMKAQIVSGDERETKKDGGRVLLNLGHTFAHAIENVFGYGYYLHGEAVGLGLLLAARMSERLGLLENSELARIENLLKIYDLPVKFSKYADVGALVAAAKLDKKNESGLARFVLLKGIGNSLVRSDIPESLMREIFNSLYSSH